MTEAILEPDLPIIDPHHHLWDLRPMMGAFPEPLHPFIAALVDNAYYTFDQLHAHLTSGHNVIGTVFMECGAFYNAEYGDAKKTVGEVEFVNGVAAQSASGLYGDLNACAAIIGHADLTSGDGAAEVLEALKAAAPGRFKGIRHQGAWDADPEVLGAPFHAPEGLYLDSTFREGFKHLGKMGLTFDAWVLEPQIDDVIDLARAFPDQPICLDHCGTPLGMGSYHGKLHERFDGWRHKIRELAQCENVVIKLGGWRCRSAACRTRDRQPATPPKTWARCGDPISKPASRRSVRSVPCSKAITPSTTGGRTMPCSGMRSSASPWGRAQMKRRRSMPALPRGSTTSSIFCPANLSTSPNRPLKLAKSFKLQRSSGCPYPRLSTACACR